MEETETTGQETQAPETAPPSESPSQGTEIGNAASAPFDLGKIDKFNWEGEEWSVKDLKNAVLRQKDYSQKTEAIAQDRKYYENLSFDLAKVRENPALA